MGRLGHAVAPLDGVVKLLVHGQLWVWGATCQGAKTREEIHGLRHEKPLCQGWEEGKVTLGMINMAPSWLWKDYDPPQNQRTKEYQNQAGFLMSLSQPLDAQMGR